MTNIMLACAVASLAVALSLYAGSREKLLGEVSDC